MVRCSGFSICEFLVAFGLAVTLLALSAEGILLIHEFQIYHLVATRDLLRARYFLEVECPDILRKKKEIGPFSEESFFEESFFVVEAKKEPREISRQQFELGHGGFGGDAMLVRVNCRVPGEGGGGGVGESSHLLPIRLRFERYLQRGKRRTYEIHGAVFLF